MVAIPLPSQCCLLWRSCAVGVVTPLYIRADEWRPSASHHVYRSVIVAFVVLSLRHLCCYSLCSRHRTCAGRLVVLRGRQVCAETMPRRGGQLSHLLLAANPGKQFDWHTVHADMPPDKKMGLLLERIKRRKTTQGIKDMNAERELGFASKATGAPPVAALAATATDTPPALHQHSTTLLQRRRRFW